MRFLTHLERKIKQIICELDQEIPEEDRCPHLAKKDGDFYCSKDYNGKITEARKTVCCYVSLQVFCMDKERFQNCIWYKGIETFIE